LIGLLATPFVSDYPASVLLILPSAVPANVQSAVNALQTSPMPVHQDHKLDMSFIRKTGVRVVVLVRESIQFSTEPQEDEIRLIEVIAAEPRISVCFVIWESPHNLNVDKWADTHTKTWQSYAEKNTLRSIGGTQIERVTCVEVRLISPNQLINVQMHEVINEDLKEAVVNADARYETIAAKVITGVDEVHRECSRVLSTISKNEGITPAQFQRQFALDIRNKFLEKLAESGKNKTKAHNFKLPKIEFLMREFVVQTADIFEEDRGKKSEKAKSAQSINELPCRDFLFQLLVGQTMETASSTATACYQRVMNFVFEEVGNRFNVSGPGFMRELEIFCNKVNPGARGSGVQAEAWEREMKVECMLLEFLQEENFVSMYVGCVLAEVVPLLYCTVSPPMLQDLTGKLTTENYARNLATARSILIR